MRIATWNVERLKHFDQINTMQSLCRDAAANILVLTETDSRIHLDYKYCIETHKVKDIILGLYKDTENRVSIYTDYPIIRQYDTYDPYTAICAEIETDKGNLLVYGTIMGIFGNREKSYKSDLEMQMKDVRRLSENGSLLLAPFTISGSPYLRKISWSVLTILQCLMNLLRAQMLGLQSGIWINRYQIIKV